MIQVTVEQARTRFKKLPEPVQDAIFSPHLPEIISQALQAQHASDDRMSGVADALSMVLLGFAHQKDLAREMQERTGLPLPVCHTIAGELQAKVIEPIADDVQRSYAPSPDEEHREGPRLLEEIKAPVVPSSVPGGPVPLGTLEKRSSPLPPTSPPRTPNPAEPRTLSAPTPAPHTAGAAFPEDAPKPVSSAPAPAPAAPKMMRTESEFRPIRPMGDIRQDIAGRKPLEGAASMLAGAQGKGTTPPPSAKIQITGKESDIKKSTVAHTEIAPPVFVKRPESASPFGTTLPPASTAPSPGPRAMNQELSAVPSPIQASNISNARTPNVSTPPASPAAPGVLRPLSSVSAPPPVVMPSAPKPAIKPVETSDIRPAPQDEAKSEERRAMNQPSLNISSASNIRAPNFTPPPFKSGVMGHESNMSPTPSPKPFAPNLAPQTPTAPKAPESDFKSRISKIMSGDFPRIAPHSDKLAHVGAPEDTPHPSGVREISPPHITQEKPAPAQIPVSNTVTPAVPAKAPSLAPKFVNYSEEAPKAPQAGA